MSVRKHPKLGVTCIGIAATRIKEGTVVYGWRYVGASLESNWYVKPAKVVEIGVDAIGRKVVWQSTGTYLPLQDNLEFLVEAEPVPNDWGEVGY